MKRYLVLRTYTPASTSFVGTDGTVFTFREFAPIYEDRAAAEREFPGATILDVTISPPPPAGAAS
jgi:hypothetical protein